MKKIRGCREENHQKVILTPHYWEDTQFFFISVVEPLRGVNPPEPLRNNPIISSKEKSMKRRKK